PMVASGQIVEFLPFYTGTTGIPSVALVCAILASVITSRDRVRAGEVLGLLLATALIIKFGRFMPVFAFVASPLFAATLPAMPARLLENRLVWTLGVVTALFVGYGTIAAFPRPGPPH